MYFTLSGLLVLTEWFIIVMALASYVIFLTIRAPYIPPGLMDVKILDGNFLVNLGMFAFMSSDVDSYYPINDVFQVVYQRNLPCYNVFLFYFYLRFILLGVKCC
ncbi:hypothetical protein OIU76_003950 [Salix suchowensis]|uniref:Uncharacterized protein n=1 Tax=Salix suchowensis TaxID=1278906 RepID=A0ABQ9BN59_9ROSI|nr:hypothetical protein OIU76_003950 [Salix suchowensis]KAJ6388588.1 hypothetical protein OIU77_027029 [Salix suchowensis]